MVSTLIRQMKDVGPSFSPCIGWTLVPNMDFPHIPFLCAFEMQVQSMTHVLRTQKAAISIILTQIAYYSNYFESTVLINSAPK